MARALTRRVAGNAGRALRRGRAWLALPRTPHWLRVRVGAPVPEAPGVGLPWSGSALPLLSLLDALARAPHAPGVAGVLLRFSGPPGGWARCATLRRAVAAVREAGLPVVAYAESYDAHALWVASAADRVALPPSGSVALLGLRLEALYLGEAMRRLGLSAEVVHTGQFKTAGETLVRDAMSAAQREQLEALVDDAYRTLLGDLSAGRRLPEARVAELVDAGPLPAAAAVEAGLVDGALYPDEIEAWLLELAPAARREERPLAVDAADWSALRGFDPGWQPLARDLPRLAYVVADGTIHRGSGRRGVAADPYRQLLEALREEESVAGVCLRIDSPGGEVVASDLIARAVARVVERKPVVVSMGDAAASGGYLIAAPASAIVAEPGTLTGSIGVVGGKLALGALYERLGVRREAVERGARAGLFSEARGFDADERQLVRGGMDALYGHFVARVAAGRHLESEGVEQLARGRVWSGRAALAHGLVDRLGGPLEALAELRQRLGLAADAPARVDVHPIGLRWPRLFAWLRRRAAAGRLGRSVTLRPWDVP